MHQVNIIEKFFFFLFIDTNQKLSLLFPLSFLVRQQETSVDRRKKSFGKSKCKHQSSSKQRGDPVRIHADQLHVFFLNILTMFPPKFFQHVFFLHVKKTTSNMYENTC